MPVTWRWAAISWQACPPRRTQRGDSPDPLYSISMLTTIFITAREERAPGGVRTVFSIGSSTANLHSRWSSCRVSPVPASLLSAWERQACAAVRNRVCSLRLNESVKFLIEWLFVLWCHVCILKKTRWSMFQRRPFSWNQYTYVSWTMRKWVKLPEPDELHSAKKLTSDSDRRLTIRAQYEQVICVGGDWKSYWKRDLSSQA